MTLRIASALMCLALLAPAASALPIVSVDPANASVGPTDSFAVDIVVSGVDPAAPVNAFEFNLLFDPSVVAATAVVDGGFLLIPKIVIQMGIGVTTVEFAEVTLLPAGASGSGILATVFFDAIGLGTSALDLADVILSAPFGVEIATQEIVDGRVTVGAAGPVIPEPGSPLLFAAGFLLVAWRCRA